ncbi:MAG TPA: hypothetical protein DHO02_05380 [Syntrophaceae bacterium]|nr:hypothetical protein [Syntrophaceae bacterium]
MIRGSRGWSADRLNLSDTGSWIFFVRFYLAVLNQDQDGSENHGNNKTVILRTPQINSCTPADQGPKKRIFILSS